MTLKEYLKLTGETAHEFALRANVSASQVSRILSGKRKAGEKARQRIFIASDGRVAYNDLYEMPALKRRRTKPAHSLGMQAV
jgi:transcriptional regulator with XRE-family HTH domain